MWGFQTSLGSTYDKECTSCKNSVYLPCCLLFSLPSLWLQPQLKLRKTESAKPAAVQVAQVTVVNLNTADAATLQRELADIGAAKAQAIVVYREEHGNSRRSMSC